MKAEGCLPPAAVEELAALEAEHSRIQEKSKAEREESKVEAVMAELREFGRWPLQHAPSEDPKREAERLLAQRVAKMKAAACLPPAAVDELDALEAEHEESKVWGCDGRVAGVWALDFAARAFRGSQARG